MVKNSNVVAISLFSGCGGLDIGSHLAGIPVISSIDFDEDSIKTLKQNKIFQDSKIIWGDVRGVYSKYYREIVKKHKSDKTILIGGPPCQPFSKAAYWIGNNTRKGEKDPRNMIGEYLRILKGLSPEGFLFENVESILHPTNKQVVEKIIIFLKKEKYYYKIVKANSLDYGVPQKRKRIFIIGSKKPFKTDKPKKHIFLKKLQRKKV